MSYAAGIVEKLRYALTDAYAGTMRAGQDYARANKEALAQDDVMACFQRMAHTILAAEHLQQQAERAVKDLRMCMSAMLMDSGAVKITDGAVTAYLAKRPAFVSIDEEARVPREFFAAPPPKPDLSAIKKALHGGVEVPGASLVVPNEMSLRLVTHDKAAAHKEPVL